MRSEPGHSQKALPSISRTEETEIEAVKAHLHAAYNEGKIYKKDTICYRAELDAPDYMGRLLNAKLDTVRRHLQPGLLVDLCCATGGHLFALADAVDDGLGIDFSEPFIEKARADAADGGLDHIRFEVGDATKLELGSGTVGTLYSFSALYAIPDVVSVFAEIARVLRPGGKAVLEMGNVRSLNAVCTRAYTEWPPSFPLPLAEIDRLCRDNGLDIVERRVFQILPYWADKPRSLGPLLHPVWARIMSRRVAGRMLDEWVSSLPVVRRFAYRHLLVCQKREEPNVLVTSRTAEVVEQQQVVPMTSSHSNDYSKLVGGRVEAFVEKALPHSHWGINYFNIRLMELALIDSLFADELKPTGSAFLELGCGIGLASVYFSERFAAVEGIDIDEVGVAFNVDRPAPLAGQAIVAALGYENIALHVCDTLAFMQERPDRYDLVLSVFVLEHIEAIAAVAKAVATTLRPGGQAVHIVPNTHDTIIQLLQQNLEPPEENERNKVAAGRGLRRVGGLYAPITHSEFIEDYRAQFDVNALERYLFPMLLAGLRVRRITPMREHSYAILVEKPATRSTAP